MREVRTSHHGGNASRIIGWFLVSVKFESEKVKFRGCTVVSKSVKIFSFFAFCVFILLNY